MQIGRSRHHHGLTGLVGIDVDNAGNKIEWQKVLLSTLPDKLDLPRLQQHHFQREYLGAVHDSRSGVQREVREKE
jgi:hypothetical protein